jgi:hypothetical protein
MRTTLSNECPPTVLCEVNPFLPHRRGMDSRAVTALSTFGRWILGATPGQPLGWAVRTRAIAEVGRRLGLSIAEGSRATPDGDVVRCLGFDSYGVARGRPGHTDSHGRRAGVELTTPVVEWGCPADSRCHLSFLARRRS